MWHKYKQKQSQPMPKLCGHPQIKGQAILLPIMQVVPFVYPMVAL